MTGRSRVPPPRDVSPGHHRLPGVNCPERPVKIIVAGQPFELDENRGAPGVQCPETRRQRTSCRRPERVQRTTSCEASREPASSGLAAPEFAQQTASSAPSTAGGQWPRQGGSAIMGRATAAGNVRCASSVSAELPHTTSGQKGPIEKTLCQQTPYPAATS